MTVVNYSKETMLLLLALTLTVGACVLQTLGVYSGLNVLYPVPIFIPLSLRRIRMLRLSRSSLLTHSTYPPLETSLLYAQYGRNLTPDLCTYKPSSALEKQQQQSVVPTTCRLTLAHKWPCTRPVTCRPKCDTSLHLHYPSTRRGLSVQLLV